MGNILRKLILYIKSSNKEFRTCIIDKGHLVEATLTDVNYSVYFAKSSCRDMTANNT